MLYQLSYASSQGNTPLPGRIYPLDPFRLSGTTVKVITTAIYVQEANIAQPENWDLTSDSKPIQTRMPTRNLRQPLSGSAARLLASCRVL
jgi:hypothetical protein